MIDLHCHILPGIDDGPATLDEALELARTAVAAGTTTIVATPHVSWDYPDNTASSVVHGVAGLRAALAREGIPLELRTGAEIAMTRAPDLTDAELMALRLGGPQGTHLLVECPLSTTAYGIDLLLGRLRARGHEVLLAHPERCPAFQRDPAAYERLIAQGMHGQVTAGALVGRFGKLVQTYALQLVRGGLVHAVSSDGHSVGRRPPSIGPELVEAGFSEQADWLTEAVPRAILEGRELPPFPAMLLAPPKGRRRMLGASRRAR